MRAIVLTAAIISIGSPALASSITKLVETGRTTSIVEKLCAVCDRTAMQKTPDDPRAYHVPALGPDIQRTEIRDIDGQEKLVRTEEWWGGSPVTFVSKMPGWMNTAEQKAFATQPLRSGRVNTVRVMLPPARDGIDTSATTAAVPEQQAEQNDRASSGNKRSFTNFSLRRRR